MQTFDDRQRREQRACAATDRCVLPGEVRRLRKQIRQFSLISTDFVDSIQWRHFRFYRSVDRKFWSAQLPTFSTNGERLKIRIKWNVTSAESTINADDTQSRNRRWFPACFSCRHFTIFSYQCMALNKTVQLVRQIAYNYAATSYCVTGFCRWFLVCVSWS